MEAAAEGEAAAEAAQQRRRAAVSRRGTEPADCNNIALGAKTGRKSDI